MRFSLTLMAKDSSRAEAAVENHSNWQADVSFMG
jgi:hypothetical protein